MIAGGWGLLGIAVSSLAVSAILTAYLVSGRSRLRWMDYPNQRSLHMRPVPRTGGLGILAGVAVGWIAMVWLFTFPTGWSWILGGMLLVAGVSLLDDWRGAGVVSRLVAQFSAAMFLVVAGLAVEHMVLPGFEWHSPLWLSVTLTVVFAVWMANLYNFMDGMDGLAGGMAVFGFAVMALLGWQVGDPLFAAMNLSVALAAAGFLWHNFPPARIFMGDNGSSTLGFLAAVAMLWAQHKGLFPLWVGLLVFSPFIVDATVTLAVRALKGERVWLPHRDHAYQRLVRLGWSHRRVVLLAYGLMFLTGMSAIGLVRAGPTIQIIGLGLWALFYVTIALSVWRLVLIRGGGF